MGLVVSANLLDRFLLAPLTSRREAVRALRRDIQDLEFQSTLVRRAQAHLAERAEQGISSDPIAATLACQTWLLDLARRGGLRDVQLAPGRPIAEDDVGHRIPMVMTCSGSFLGLVNFLAGTGSQADILRLSRISAAASDAQGDGDLDFAIEFEAISLLDAPAEGKPLPQTTPASKSPEIQSLKRLASGSSPFARYQPPKPAPINSTESVAAQAPTQSPPGSLILIACGSRGPVSEAWFHDSTREDAIRASVGDSLSYEGRQFQVTGIERDRVLIQDGDQRRTIELGESVLAQAQ